MTWAIFTPSFSINSPCTDGTVIFLRVTSLMIADGSPVRYISNSTTVPAGHRICSIASLKLSHSSLFPQALAMMSPERTPASFAGEPARICFTTTPNSLSSTTAPIPSKSPEMASLNFFVSSKSKYSLCRSPKAQTIPEIIPETRSLLETVPNQ